MKKIKEQGHCRIWSLSSDSNEYERYERLLEGSGKHHLDVEQMNIALIDKGKGQLQGMKSVVVIHDPSDIRKPYSEKMEGLGKVQSLEGSWVNGYHSFNSVAIGQDKRIHLLGCKPYSKEDEQWQQHRDDQIRQISRGLKEMDGDVVLIHVLDREFDDQDCFGLIGGELEEHFVVRLKLNRNAGGLEKWDEQRGKQVSVKLKEAPFKNRFEREIQKFSWGKQLHQNVRAAFEYDHFPIGGSTYGLVRVVLRTASGRRVFKEPMLLITNLPLQSEENAVFVFRTYLSRSKIEGVFKFLKDSLGWETFQVRDFQAIQHLIVLCFFIGGYFYEIGDELANNEWMQQVCLMGGGKGKVSRFFFLEGIKKIAHYLEIKIFMKENNLTEEQLKAMLYGSD